MGESAKDRAHVSPGDAMPQSRWTPLEIVKVTAAFLAEKGVASARLDSEILLCSVLGYGSRVELYANFERLISEDELTAYRALVKRRASREPVSRILGEREFMGIRFAVSPEVFAPRPETEILVEEAVRLLEGRVPPHKPDASRASKAASRSDTPTGAAAMGEHHMCFSAEAPYILDLGTGCGAIAVSVAVFCPRARVVASDISAAALAIARENAQAAGVAERIEFRCGDLFAVCRSEERWDFILSNPPYLAIGDPTIEAEAKDYDPEIALYGGEDGLAIQRRIALEAKSWLNPGGWLLVEAAAGQATAVRELFARGDLTDVRVLRDCAGRERVICGRHPTGD